MADFLNLQERTKREMENARNFAIQRFAVDLLESVDNFDRALLAVPEDKLSSDSPEHKDLQNFVEGVKMTQNIMMNALKKHGLERFDPSEPAEDGKAQKFDPNRHEATFMAKVDGKENGDIMYVQSKGFTLNGRVLRVSINFYSLSVSSLTSVLGCQGRRCQERLISSPHPRLRIRSSSTLLSV